jgi:hypothetical protein
VFLPSGPFDQLRCLRNRYAAQYDRVVHGVIELIGLQHTDGRDGVQHLRHRRSLPNAGTSGTSPTPDDIASIAASNSPALAGEPVASSCALWIALRYVTVGILLDVEFPVAEKSNVGCSRAQSASVRGRAVE